eukprot:2036738-Pyramimonas_sp.AAC.2
MPKNAPPPPRRRLKFSFSCGRPPPLRCGSGLTQPATTSGSSGQGLIGIQGGRKAYSRDHTLWGLQRRGRGRAPEGWQCDGWYTPPHWAPLPLHPAGVQVTPNHHVCARVGQTRPRGRVLFIFATERWHWGTVR